MSLKLYKDSNDVYWVGNSQLAPGSLRFDWTIDRLKMRVPGWSELENFDYFLKEDGNPYASFDELNTAFAGFFLKAGGEATTAGKEHILKQFILPAGLNNFSAATNKYFFDYGEGAGDGIDNSPNYSRSVFLITENDIEIYKGQFADRNTFVVWLENNASTSGGITDYEISVKVSFNINMPKFSKFWCYNDGYGFLKGHGNLNDKNIVFNPNINQANLNYIWANSDVPTIVGDVPRDLLWFQRKQSTVYNGWSSIYNRIQRIYLTNMSVGSRQVIRNSDSAIFDVKSIPNFDYNNDFFRSAFSGIFQINGNNGGDIIYLGFQPSTFGLYKNNVVRIHSISWYSAIEATDYNALYVKPIGYDTFDLGKQNINLTEHKLYGLFEGSVNANPIIREITPTPAVGGNVDLLSWRVKKSDIMNYMTVHESRSYSGSQNENSLKTCKLFYMDTEGNASDFSPTISATTRARGAKLKLTVGK